MSQELNEIENLRAEVDRLSKLTAIGELSAGIAHEIQNPLNFVINFSKMSDRLLDDIEDIISEQEDKLDEDASEEIQDVINDLKTNLQKIKQHGERANNTVMNILLYIRGRQDEFIDTNIPSLVKEFVNLSYFAVRANNKEFNTSFEEDIDSGLESIKIIPQDFSRAVLNVVNNAFYAIIKKQEIQGSEYKPKLKISIKKTAEGFELSIEDNGIGMSEEVQKKLFNDYFTTKPVGEGTGLGMMLTRNIIENKHKGKIEFVSKEGEFTRFTFIIPAN